MDNASSRERYLPRTLPIMRCVDRSEHLRFVQADADHSDTTNRLRILVSPAATTTFSCRIMTCPPAFSFSAMSPPPGSRVGRGMQPLLSRGRLSTVCLIAELGQLRQVIAADCPRMIEGKISDPCGVHFPGLVG
jgi:hypothetical protein